MRRRCVPLQWKNYCNAHSRQYGCGTPPGFRTAPARTLRPGRRNTARRTQHDQGLRDKRRTSGRQAVPASEPAAAVIYTFFRRSKARRSYEHAVRLRALGIDSPEPIAWSEYRRHGLLSDTYYVSRRLGLRPAVADHRTLSRGGNPARTGGIRPPSRFRSTKKASNTATSTTATSSGAAPPRAFTGSS